MHEQSIDRAWREKMRGLLRGNGAADGQLSAETRLPKAQDSTPGAAGGIEHHELSERHSTTANVTVDCTDYSPDQTQTQRVEDLESFLVHHRPPWAAVRWINVDGLTDMTVIHALAKKYDLHPLAIEDVLQVPQRPKVEDYCSTSEHQARLFIVARMMMLVGQRLHSEQISFFLGHSTLITFQESPGDLWQPVRQRIATGGSRLRQNDASFLLYTLLDAIVDQCFPILEYYSDCLEDLEDAVLARSRHELLEEIHTVKRELLVMRRAVWPMREVIHALQREPHECMCDETRTYLRDVYDHCIQMIDLIETYREFANSLTETYMSALSIRANEIMKVLTVMGTIFIPLTFLAGVYGMNMPIPEAQSPWMYPTFWLVCVATATAMLVWFKRRGWL
jgi:magnesium transporter